MIIGFKYIEGELGAGAEIVAHEDHFNSLSEDKKKAEAAIRRADPRGDLRAVAVYVFENEDVAKALLDEETDRSLYEVLVRENDVLHRADLTIYDEIVESLRNREPVDHLLKAFWDGVQRPAPRIELAVARIRINRKLVGNAG